MKTKSSSKIRFTERVTTIKTSPTLVVMNRAAELAASGVDVVDFGPGEPDFATPANVSNAAKQAIDRGFTKYTNALGTNELRDCIAAKYARQYGAKVDRRNVITGSGGKQELFNLILALVSDGDEVVIPSPYWVSFPDQVIFAGGTPVFAQTDPENGFRPTMRDIERVTTERTRALILNSPNNPTGAVIEHDELAKIVRFCVDRDIFLIYDETYEFFVYDGAKHVSAAEFFNEFPESIAVVNSMSKTYAMTGWRLGFALAHPDIISATGKIQSHSTSNPSSISQFAACEALRSSGEEVDRMLSAYVERRSWLVPHIAALPGVSCRRPDGAFYIFPRVSDLFGHGNVKDSTSLCNYLLEDARVACVPGAAFGADEFVRISYATSMERIKEGVARMEASLGRLLTK